MVLNAGPLFFIALIMVGVGVFLSGFFARRAILSDEPNDRSSHDAPTSRAGGIVIFAVFLIGITLVFMQGISTELDIVSRKLPAFLGLALLAVLLGLGDDIFNLKPVLKFVGQFLLATAFAIFIGHFTTAPVPFLGQTGLGIVGIPITIFWVVGMMNAYNFMDGANGLAAIVAIFVSLMIAILAGFVGANSLMVIAILLAMAIFSFFPQNFFEGGPFAKGIFMGDSGSQGISFMIAGFAVLLSMVHLDSSQHRISILTVPVLMMPFIVDVTLTLLDRYRRGQNLLKAHREHIYQLLLRMGWSHKQVTVLYLGATIICGAGALIMMSQPPAWQWLMPVLLAALLWGVGTVVSRKGRIKGLLVIER